jgi:CRISPR-associated endonuclease Cas1
MAASHTLPHSSVIPQIPKSGVLTLYGYGIRVTMQAGHLQVQDGIGPDRRNFRLPRVNHRLKRLVCIGEDGFVTLSALRWLSDVGASFAMLDRLGKIRVITGPTSPSESRLRRAQALALGNVAAVNIARELISAKLTGQEMLVREKLQNNGTADSIAMLRTRLTDAPDLSSIRGIESRAAAKYWSAWRDIPILFPRKDAVRVPAHWLTFGPRHSPLTGGPRRSVNPPNSLLNYTNAVAESECRLAACACGLDPALGFLHTDTANRDSLALDLIETIRPAIEAWLLDWLMHEPLRLSDFSESADGNCRISSSLCSKLAEPAPVWGRLVAPWAEYVTDSLYRGHSGRTTSIRVLKTPLTQSHRRQAKGALLPEPRIPNIAHACPGCGKPIPKDHGSCLSCSIPSSTERLIQAARLGRVVARSSEARAKHARSARTRALACHHWDSSTQPAWLTPEFFSKEIGPHLANLRTSTIRKQLGVSSWYASKIRKGAYRPHPRHWKVLARMTGFSKALQ